MHLGKGQRKCMHNGNMVPVPIVQHNSMPFIPRSRSQYMSTTTNRYIILKSSQIFQATNQQQTFQWLLSTFNQLLSDVWLSLAEFQTLQAHFSISKTIHELFSRFKIQGSFRLALISRQAWEPRMFFFQMQYDTEKQSTWPTLSACLSLSTDSSDTGSSVDADGSSAVFFYSKQNPSHRIYDMVLL